MKILSIIILLLVHTIKSYGQYDFDSDSSSRPFLIDKFSGTQLEMPNFDSTSFEIRFWIHGNHGGFIQLSLNKDSIWSYRRGFLQENYRVKTLEMMTESIDLKTVWSQLVSNHVLDLPNQDELVLTYQKDGRSIKIGPDNKESIIHRTLDGTGYTIELFRKEKYRSYYYYNPIVLNEHFQRSSWSSIETENFANIVKTLLKSFSMNEVFKANIFMKIENN